MTRKDQPLVSIILPMYNCAQTLSASLRSLLSQTYRNIEIIAVDDHSTDQSYSLLRKAKRRDSRIKIIRNKKRYGLTICLNRALGKAKAMFVAFADVQGKSTKDRIKKQLNFLLNNPKTVALGSQCQFFNHKGKKAGRTLFPIDHEGIAQNLITGLSIDFTCVMINKYLFPKDILELSYAYTSFSPNKRINVYADILMKLLPYGEFANLPLALNLRPKLQNNQSTISQVTNILKLWVKSLAVYETRLPVRTLFTPLIKQA